MMRVEKDFEEFIALLNEHDVQYVIVGAFAISFHARPRFTGDIDFFINNSSTNIRSLLEVLKNFGFESLNLSKEDFRSDSIIQLGNEPNRIDLLTSISGVDFKQAFSNKVEGKYGDEVTYFISLDDLIANKKAGNRLKDKSDLEMLEKFR